MLIASSVVKNDIKNQSLFVIMIHVVELEGIQKDEKWEFLNNLHKVFEQKMIIYSCSVGISNGKDHNWRWWKERNCVSIILYSSNDYFKSAFSLDGGKGVEKEPSHCSHFLLYLASSSIYIKAFSERVAPLPYSYIMFNTNIF